MTGMHDFLTVREVAEICRVHESTVRRLIGAGEIESVRVGRSVRIRPRDLDAYLRPAHDAEHDDEEGAWPRDLKPLTEDDGLWTIVGMIDDPEGEWVSGDIHRAVADAVDIKR